MKHTLSDLCLNSVLQHLLQRVVESTDGCGVEHFYQVGHLSFGWIIEDGMVPGIGHAFIVDAEYSGGQSVELAWSRLDVVFGVVL